MRRTLLVMSLGWIATATACKSSDDAPKVSASSTTPATGSGSAPAPAAAPAGRVLEVAGTVTAFGKPLAVGDTVVASAVIETGADGSVAIELIHNLVRWELGPNKHVRVDESLAWREPKRAEVVAEVEHDTVSAGRPVERQAASTTVSVDTKPKPDPKQGAAGDAKSGESIGLGKIGTIGHGAGTGTGQGYGAGAGRLGGSHTTKAPKIAQGDAQVSGSLPPEVIKRIVRQHFGQLRMCYENGLRSNPALAGKVVVRFVIDRGGEVSNATSQSSTLGDETVVACMVKVFSTLTFPQPEGGIVTVSYPIAFSPE